MATRLYFNTTTVPPVSPTFDTSWEATGSAVRRMLEDAAITGKGLENFAPATILNTPAGAVDVLAVQYVSPQLASNVTISGAIRGQMQMLESAAAADLDVQTVIWVMKTDGTSRGTLIASDATGLSHEFNITTARNISIPKGGSTVPSSVAALATDRIVVELGYRKHENAVTSRTGTLRGGNELGTDLPVDETTTTILTPWIEFTETLTFTTSLRESETVAETLLGATDPRLFESETVVQVLLSATPDRLVTVPLLDGARALYAPTLVYTKVIDLGLLGVGPSLFAPTVVGGSFAQTLTLGLLTSTSALYSPTLVYTKVIDLGLLGAGPFLYSPVVVGGAFTQTLTLGLLTSTSTLYSPTLIYSKDITLGLLDAGPFLYSPTVVGGSFTQTLTVPLLGAPALYAPSIANKTQIVSLPVLVSARVLQVPVLTITGGSRTVVLSLLDSERFLYPPTLTTGAVYVPGPGAAPPSIVIRVNGVDVTDIVRYSDALFVSQVNGTAGLCQLAVRDLGHDQAFVFGQSITLEIGGILRWSGYLQTINRQYSAAVVDTTEPTETARWLLLAGSDVNILFSRRVTHDPAHPTRLTALSPPVAYRDAVHAEQWKEDTPSDVVVKYFISHYTDMVADGVSMGGVENLGSPNPDWAAAYAAAQTVGDFMRSVNTLLGGIWYLEPDKTLVHRAIETVTTPKYLSDYVDGNPNRVGVRDYSFVSDASAMVNDAHVWGTAAGVSTIRHSHVNDEASIAAHGLWQGGEFNQSMYKQTSLDSRAEALVYGNDASRHGAKDDRILVQATVYEPVFFLGDVVTCYSHVFEDAAGQELPYEDADVLTAILPIRRIAYSFPTPTSVKYDLLLTQELDEPWSIYEYKFPKLKIPKGTGPGPIKWPKPPVLPPPVDPGGCSAELCGITDSFTRNLAAGWGTSDSGHVWDWDPAYPAGMYLSATHGVFYHPSTPAANDSDYVFAALYTGAGSTLAVTHRIRFEAQDLTASGSSSWYAGGNGGTAAWIFEQNAAYTAGFASQFGLRLMRWDLPSDRDVVEMALTTGVWYRLRFETTTAYARIRFWIDGDPEPATWDAQVTYSTTSTVALDGYYLDSQITDGPNDALEIWYDDLDIDGVNRCGAVQFDNFNRSLTGSFGSNLRGFPYNNQFISGTWGVDGSAAYAGGGASGVIGQYNYDSEPFDNKDFVMTSRIKLDTLPTNVSGSTIWHYRVEDSVTGDYAWAEVTVAYGVPAHIRLSYSVGPNTDGIQDDVPFTAGTWYLIKWDTRSGMKIWAEGTSEPSTWHVLVQPVHHRDRLYLIMQSRFKASIDYIDFDYDGKPCYGCQYIFESFDRTITSGIGTSDSGYSWVITGFAGTYGVNGTSAYATGSLGFLAASIDAAAPDYATDFVMNARFRSTLIPSSSPTPAISFTVFDRLGGGIEFTTVNLRLNSATGGAAPGGILFDTRTGGTVVPKTDWLANTWYRVKWSTTSGVKVWPESQPEPTTWQITQATAAFSRPSFRVNIGSITSSTSEVDYIDFDYDGKPCFPAGNGGVEDFARPDVTVVQTDFTTGVDLTHWGVGPLGQWSLMGLDNFSAASGSGIGIENETGVHRRIGGTGPAPARVLYAALPPHTWTLPIEIIMDSYRESFTNNGIEVALQSTLDTLDDPGHYGDWISAEFMNAGSSGGPGGYQSLQWFINDGTEYGSTGGGDSITPGLGFTTYQTQRTRWLIEETQMRSVAYRVNDPQPAWQLAVSYPAGTLDRLLGSAFITVHVWAHNDGATYLDRIEIVTAEATAAAGSSGIPLYGEVWETISHVGGSDFATTRAWTGPLQVWINGELTMSFTATPSAGEFHLLTSIGAADVLRVRYQANGDPI